MTHIFRPIAALLLGACLAPVVAYADDAHDCHAPMKDWQPRAAVLQQAQAWGWQVDAIQIDDGCYKLLAHDASGHPVEALIDPITLRPHKDEDD